MRWKMPFLPIDYAPPYAALRHFMPVDDYWWWCRCRRRWLCRHAKHYAAVAQTCRELQMGLRIWEEWDFQVSSIDSAAETSCRRHAAFTVAVTPPPLTINSFGIIFRRFDWRLFIADATLSSRRHHRRRWRWAFSRFGLITLRLPPSFWLIYHDIITMAAHCFFIIPFYNRHALRCAIWKTMTAHCPFRLFRQRQRNWRFSFITIMFSRFSLFSSRCHHTDWWYYNEMDAAARALMPLRHLIAPRRHARRRHAPRAIIQRQLLPSFHHFLILLLLLLWRFSFFFERISSSRFTRRLFITPAPAHHAIIIYYFSDWFYDWFHFRFHLSFTLITPITPLRIYIIYYRLLPLCCCRLFSPRHYWFIVIITSRLSLALNFSRRSRSPPSSLLFFIFTSSSLFIDWHLVYYMDDDYYRWRRYRYYYLMIILFFTRHAVYLSPKTNDHFESTTPSVERIIRRLLYSSSGSGHPSGQWCEDIFCEDIMIFWNGHWMNGMKWFSFSLSSFSSFSIFQFSIHQFHFHFQIFIYLFSLIGFAALLLLLPWRCAAALNELERRQRHAIHADDNVMF